MTTDQRSIYPEIVIYQDNTIDTIIDLKSAIYSLQYKDLNIYPHVAKHVIFWVLKGDSCTIKYKNHTLQFISSNDLINLLFNHNVQLDTDNTVPIQNLVTKIRELTLIPEDIQRLRTASLQDYV